MTATTIIPRARALHWIAGTSMLALMLTALSAAFYFAFTRDYPGANDFYVPWRATQAVFLDSRNPYSAEVTRDIQNGMLGYEMPTDEHQWGFAYPLYTVLLLAPLAILPYDAAQALWQTLSLALLFATVAFSLKALRWRVHPVALTGLMITFLSTYPVVRAFVLGQIAIVVSASVAAAWWAAVRRRDALAGALLAIATVKPQMVFLLLPLVLWCAFQTRRFGVIRGFVGTWGALVVAALVLQPGWLLDFVGATRAYAAYFDSVTPIQIALGDGWASYAITGLLVLSLALAALRAARKQWREPLGVFAWAIIVSQLIAVHTATPNQLLLLLPLLLSIDRLPVRTYRQAIIALALGSALIVPWLVFQWTRIGNVEAPVAILPLSFGIAAWWLAVEWLRYRTRQPRGSAP